MITMSALPTIIKATVLREYRSKTIFFMAGITILSLVLINIFLRLFANSVEDTGEFNVLSAYGLSFFIAIMNIWCVLISTILGSNSFAGDQENGLMSTMLSFPITRETYILGRFIGISTVVVLLYLFAYTLAIAMFSFYSKTFLIGPEIFHSFIYLCLTILAVVILSGLLGLLMPRVFAVATMLVASGIYGQVVSTQFQINEIQTGSDIFVSIIAFIFPRIKVMSDISSFVLNKGEIPYNLIVEVPHFVVISFVWFVIVSFIVKKKDF